MVRRRWFSGLCFLMSLAYCLSLSPNSNAWDGNWIDAPSGDYLYDSEDSTGKAGFSPDPQTYFEAAPRKFEDVDPEELSEYFGKHRRPDYSPYALLRLTQTLHYGADITLPLGYYLVKAGDAGDGSPKAHDPNGASGDKTLQQTGPNKPTGGSPRGGSSIDAGDYPDLTGMLAIEDISQSSTMPEQLAEALKSSPLDELPVLEGHHLLMSDAPEINHSLLAASGAAFDDFPIAMADKKPPKTKRITGPLRKILPPILTDPYAPDPRSEKHAKMPRVFIFKKMGRVVAVIPIHRVQRYVPADNGKIPPHPLIWLDSTTERRPILKFYDRNYLFSSDFE